MWVIFPLVPLLIRAILANPEIDDTTLPDIMELGNDSNDILTDNHTEKSWNEIWKVWKKGSLKGERNEKAPNNILTGEKGNSRSSIHFRPFMKSFSFFQYRLILGAANEQKNLPGRMSTYKGKERNSCTIPTISTHLRMDSTTLRG